MPVPNADYDVNGDDERSYLRCDFCGDLIGTSNHNAGNYEKRNDGEVVLHRNDYCDVNWDKENPEPPLSLYVWRNPYCLVCHRPITDEEKSASVEGGFVHFGSDFVCYNEYEIAKDLQDATGPDAA